MEELSEVLKNNRTQDISWLCSLSEPELVVIFIYLLGDEETHSTIVITNPPHQNSFLQDLLISLKKLAIHRAEITDHYELADYFDLKLLRALGMLHNHDSYCEAFHLLQVCYLGVYDRACANGICKKKGYLPCPKRCSSTDGFG